MSRSNWLRMIACISLMLANGFVIAQKQPVWIDADTGNETDDIYALARIISEPTVNMVGLSSAGKGEVKDDRIYTMVNIFLSPIN